MKIPMDNITDVKVDVATLKAQITILTQLCEKMDRVIEKIVNQQEKYIAQVYDDMEKRRVEKNTELKEVHSRIDTVIDKVELTERRIKDEIKELRLEMSDKFQKEQESVEKLSQWKWMAAGGIVVMSWLISHIDYDIIEKIFK
jgi:chromosome segregation ATPase